ncbi:MAG: hypothetical protein AUJ96_15400 [Armatimonadetes bacterium CG2_30_66_41]|nr:MAG: hypothetical protein AUJ96_15400 [Armatimonadetes bacterium CG2_30_66_41]
MKPFEAGDVVLAPFLCSEETGTKRRPALVLSSGAYHTGRQETIIAAITSNVDSVLVGDHVIADWRGAGLRFPSKVAAGLRTIKQQMVERKLGALSHQDFETFRRGMDQWLARSARG